MLSTGADPINALRNVIAWYAPMQDATLQRLGFPALDAPVLEDKTVRHVLRLSFAGQTFRLKLSNLYGTESVTFSEVRVAVGTNSGEIDPATDCRILFSDSTSLALAPGTESFSDSFSIDVHEHASLAVSMYFAKRTMLPTVHSLGRPNAFVASGNAVSAPAIAVATDLTYSYIGLTAVETTIAGDVSVVVAFGDSISDGYNTPDNDWKRYPNLLDDRIKAAELPNIGVINAGLSGNRWLHDWIGPRASERIGRDMLGIAGATHAIILLGINDIGLSVDFGGQQEVTAGAVIAALDVAVKQASSNGIKVILGTLLPFKGSEYYTAAGEAKRLEINAWVRSNPGTLPVVDFDAVMRDPADPLRLLPAYDSGDHLHPNTEGSTAMAMTVDLALLR